MFASRFRAGRPIIARSANAGASPFISAPDLERKWGQPVAAGDRGRPPVYPDAVIQPGVVLQQVYRLPLRQTVGLLRSVLDLAGLRALPVPDPSTLCRRRAGVALPTWPKAGGCIVVDSTGLQIRGPGTWLTTVHGLLRRTYRKIHLGVDPTTSLVVAGVVTSCQQHDCQVLGAVLDVARPQPGTVVIGDGAYDRRMGYAAAKRHHACLVSPPGSRAVLHPGDNWIERNRSIEEARFLGRPDWKIAVGYHRRSLAESAMHRLNSAFGQRLRSRLEHNQAHEALLRAHLLNHWVTPATVSVS
ncbi:MAG: IS5 family transposase [Betaproteobacteria bacterium]